MSTKRIKSKVRNQLKQDKRESQRFHRNSRKRQGLVEEARKRRAHLKYTLGGELLKIDPSKIADPALRNLVISAQDELDTTDRALEALGLTSQKHRIQALCPNSVVAGSGTSVKPSPGSDLVTVTVGFRAPPSDILLTKLKGIRFRYYRDERVWRGRANPDVVRHMISTENCQELVRLFEPSG